MHHSLKPDGARKGSYYRRIEDMLAALEYLRVDDLSDEMKFLTYFFACEKLEKAVIGISRRISANGVFRSVHDLAAIKKGVSDLSLTISDDDLAWLFGNDSDVLALVVHAPQGCRPAKQLRNALAHELGPSNAQNITKYAPFHIPKMKFFLSSAEAVLAYQRANFSAVI